MINTSRQQQISEQQSTCHMAVSNSEIQSAVSTHIPGIYQPSEIGSLGKVPQLVQNYSFGSSAQTNN
ncbi:hypothetical protein FGO68_gene847 [Halteria grandinella]|uniref:Uncharacterized protein n=1 Tax=Halteria grandinella TaxID=5974 RepID=A0A8J8NXB4_HALGN|nr:hypothetical protein FGO68_gene847 [Halteria grandinella]